MNNLYKSVPLPQFEKFFESNEDTDTKDEKIKLNMSVYILPDYAQTVIDAVTNLTGTVTVWFEHN